MQKFLLLFFFLCCLPTNVYAAAPWYANIVEPIRKLIGWGTDPAVTKREPNVKLGDVKPVPEDAKPLLEDLEPITASEDPVENACLDKAKAHLRHFNTYIKGIEAKISRINLQTIAEAALADKIEKEKADWVKEEGEHWLAYSQLKEEAPIREKIMPMLARLQQFEKKYEEFKVYSEKYSDEKHSTYPTLGGYYEGGRERLTEMGNALKEVKETVIRCEAKLRNWIKAEKRLALLTDELEMYKLKLDENRAHKAELVKAKEKPLQFRDAIVCLHVVIANANGLTSFNHHLLMDKLKECRKAKVDLENVKKEEEAKQKTIVQAENQTNEPSSTEHWTQINGTLDTIETCLAHIDKKAREWEKKQNEDEGTKEAQAKAMIAVEQMAKPGQQRRDTVDNQRRRATAARKADQRSGDRKQRLSEASPNALAPTETLPPKSPPPNALQGQ